jgi:hypothetical protein
MRRARTIVAALLLATPALAQHAGVTAGNGVPDVPQGPAAIHGRVVREGRPSEVGDVEVVLYALPQGAAPGLRRTRTAADGSFAFEGIANDANTAYLVGARVADVPFPGERTSFKAGELDRQVEIRIAEPTTDPSVVAAGDLKLRLDSVGGRLVVTETQHLKNGSDRVFYVPTADRERLPPAFRTTLPVGATELTGPLGILPEGLVQQGGALAFFGPIYPGAQDLTLSYAFAVAESGATLRRRLPTGAQAVSVLVPEQGPSVSAAALRPGENVTIDGRSYRSLAAAGLRPGTEIALDLTMPAAQSDPAALSVQEVRAFLEQDGAALTVRAEHHLVVAGDRMLVAKPGETLYRITLPENARDVRFATEPTGIALTPDPEGGIDVSGPIPAGESTVEILYHVPVEDGSSALTLESSRAVPLLSIFVADTGLDLRSERLHRRRPVKTEDRTYLYLEAFELEPGEKVALEVSSLDRGDGAGRSLALGAALFGAVAIAAALLAPLRKAAATPEAVAADDEQSDLGERASLYAAMRDLEEDFETGKLSEADHAVLREELRGRAATLLQSERDAKRERPRPEPAAAPVSPAARFCTSCGAPLAAGDRFCAQCGTKVATTGMTTREASA